MRLTALLVFSVACAAPQISVAPPLLGLIQDACGAVREVRGAAGSFQLGPAIEGAKPPRPVEKDRARLEGRTLVVHGRDGLEKRILLPAPAAPPRVLGAGWLAAFPFAIRIAQDAAEVYRLPAPPCGGRP
jgi:hypothetical protein